MSVWRTLGQDSACLHGVFGLSPRRLFERRDTIHSQNGIVSSQLFPACDKFEGKQVDVHSRKISSRSERHLSFKNSQRSGRLQENTVSMWQLIKPYK